MQVSQDVAHRAGAQITRIFWGGAVLAVTAWLIAYGVRPRIIFDEFNGPTETGDASAVWAMVAVSVAGLMMVLFSVVAWGVVFGLRAAQQEPAAAARPVDWVGSDPAEG